ncbi:MAG: cache domain-containing protein [Pseudomonadota bacterium]
MAGLFMRMALFWLLCAMPAAAAAGPGDGDTSLAPKAVAMVKKAAAYYQRHGAAQAFAQFMNPRGEFIDGELYIAVHDARSGVALAHGGEPKVVGQSLLELRDSDGVYVIKAIIEVGNRPSHSGWTEYKWPHPVSRKWVLKRAYTERVGDVLITCGYYPAASDARP